MSLLVGRPLGEVEAAGLDGLHELAHALLLHVLLAHLQEDLGDAGLLGKDQYELLCRFREDTCMYLNI